MHNAYHRMHNAYQTFFNHKLSSESNRTDYLFYNELFKMDVGKTKIKEEKSSIFWKWNGAIKAELKSVMSDGITEEQCTMYMWNL